MGKSWSQSLRRHVHDCETLREHIGALIDDLKFADIGGVVRYVVDFSEIYSYTFPFRQIEYMRVFRDDDVETLRMAQYVASDVIFHGLPTKLILIAPYAVELRAFVATWPQHHLEELAANAAAAFVQARELQSDQEFQQLRNLVTHHGKDLPVDTISRMVGYFETKGAKLVMLMEDLDRAPMHRLTALLESEPFDSLGSILSGRLELEPEVIQRWDTGLRAARKGRPPGSSYLDAKAIATIKAANEHMEGSKTRLRLITKSRIMRDLLQKELDDGLWDRSSANILRHPRSFAALGALRTESGKAALRQLEALEKSLAVFLESFRELGGEQMDLPDESAELEGRISHIKAQWRAVTGLSSAMAREGREHELARTGADNARGQIAGILEFVRSYETLSKFVKQRVDELADALRGGYQDLGVLLQGQRTEQQAILERKLEYRSLESDSLLTSSLHWMPYGIHFYSAEVANWAKRIEGRVELRLDEALDWLSQTFSPGPNYERLLWMAYVFGAWDRWRLAEMYCALALGEQSLERKPSPHEGLFFRAFCRRRQATTPSDYEEAQRLLDEASQAKVEASDRPELDDPRFLRERATLILRWHDAHERLKGLSAGEPSPPPIDEALHLLERALQQLNGDTRMEALIHNDLCYHYLNEVGDEARERARAHYERLVEVQERLEDDPNKWPPNILDTVAFGRWKLRERPLAAEDQRKVIGMLKDALRHEETSDRERTVIRRHLDEVRHSEP